MRGMGILLALASLGSLSACSLFAGGGTDQPNELSSTVVARDGSPLVGARIALRQGPFAPDTNQALAWNPAPTVASILSGTEGRFRISAPEAGRYFLEAHAPDSSQVAVLAEAGGPGGLAGPDTVRLSLAVRLCGWVDDGTRRIHSLQLSGTHYQAQLGENGAFCFPPLFPGRYRLIAKSSRAGEPAYVLVDSLILEEGETRRLDSLAVPPDSLMLFDFEQARTRSALKGILYPAEEWSAGRIYTVESAQDILPIDDSSAEVSLTSDQAHRGYSLRLKASAGRPYHFNLGNRYYDLGKVDEIAFFAKSSLDSLVVRVGFATEIVKSGEGTFFAEVKVGPAWSRIVIKPGDIQPTGAAAASGLTWTAVRSGVVRITFQPKQAATLHLDDLHLVGASHGDL